MTAPELKTRVSTHHIIIHAAPDDRLSRVPRPSRFSALLQAVVCSQGFTWINLTFTGGSPASFSPSTTAETEWLAVLPTWRGQHGSAALVGTAAVTHRMGKWRGRWLRGVASGSVPPFPEPGERAGMGSPISRCIDPGPALH